VVARFRARAYDQFMFQTFDDVTNPAVGPARLAALRAELSRRGLHGTIVPRADEYLNEYIPASADRLRFLTGFTGSWGMALVLAEVAALATDGRYVLQAKAQVDASAFDVVISVDTPPEVWFAGKLAAGQRIGVDPWLFTADQLAKWTATIEGAGASVVLLDDNPVDAVWTGRPAAPLGQVTIQPPELSGSSPAGKLARLQAAIAAAKADRLVVTQPDNIAWAFDVRGADVPHTPLPLSTAIIPVSGRPRLFLDGRKLSNAVRAHLESVADVMEPTGFGAALDALDGASGATIVDPSAAPAAVAARIRAAGGTVVASADPTILMKARKNAAELAGTRAAHLRDAAAMATFLAWFDREAPKGRLDEIAVARALEGFRAANGALLDVSFPSISGSGPNGAIIHYRVTEATNRPLDKNSLFLIDSGAQYRDGTTDVTRTIALGRPSMEMKRAFTLVLAGMLRLSAMRFPKGTTGHQLDAIARAGLWEAGLDYDHGTGHGVGVYLSVHEGPQRISKVASPALEPGMILSNEPGFYRPGAFGIRIENLIVVTEPVAIEGGERPMMGFETLTLAPIDRRCVVRGLLGARERAALDAYHARVFQAVAPLVDGETRAWLAQACAPL
jgi:Xaa-Pro aminopeptidase